MPHKAPAILLVEDDPDLTEYLELYLSNSGYRIAGCFSSGEEAVKNVSELHPDLILMDIVLGGEIDGIEAARQIHQDLDIPLLYLTAHTDENFLQRAKITSPFAYILKPFNERELHLTIHFALQKHRMERDIRESQQHLASAQRIGKMGSWEWNIEADTLKWSDEIYRIFGLAPQQFDANYGAFLDMVHEDDRERVKQAVDAALYRSRDYDIDHQIRLHNGSIKVVHEQAEVLFDNNGTPLQMIGTVQDITERQKADDRR
ncbi:hypothetical protein BOW53_05685 [Solemya pervernicosa gill symbiont]|uniref:histidine kinase n=1 Tax=Solemya pervernicosa gill symbiont TaxID=642797 RepID=A0A1T2L7F9_9GAMM|nr:response regulator [Solemya pervernicosa gill symbiont]OOZ41013.1 hypothetical protein BOW53_05685 [Solemya pervernicosa gill symbiont]